MMNNKEIECTARPVPGDYEGRSHRACVWYNRARAAFDLATLDTLTTAADKAADRVPTLWYVGGMISGALVMIAFLNS